MNKIKIAVIGATGTALKRTIPALRHSEVCEVIAIQGRNEAKLRAAAQQYGIPHYFLSTEEMLQEVSCELAFIGNPPFLHFESVKTALQYGKAVLCEKPLAANTVFLSASQSMKHPGNHLLIYGTEGSIEIFGGIGEGSIEKIDLSNGNGARSYTYEKENLYGNEVEDFVRAHFLADAQVHAGASLEEALMSLKVIELIRESSAQEQYQTF